MPNNTGLEYRLVTEGSFWRENKFGQDRPGGGSSKEPFITTPLPGVNEQNPNLGLLGGNGDFILRSGTLKRSADDVSRITQFFTTGKGLQFAAKQNLLSRMGVQTQASGKVGLNEGIYLPTSTIAQVGLVGSGGHLNKQGINPFAETGETAGIGLPFGLSDPTAIPLYTSKVNLTDNSQQRLIDLKNSKISPSQDVSSTANTKSFGSTLGNIISVATAAVANPVGTARTVVNKLLGISEQGEVLIEYPGGPGSEGGVGTTRIRRFDTTLTDEFAQDFPNLFTREQIDARAAEAVNNRGSVFQDLRESTNLVELYDGDISNNGDSPTNSYNTEAFRKSVYLLDQGAISSLSTAYQNQRGKIQQDFRKLLIRTQANGNVKSILTDSPDYERKNIEDRVNLGNPGRNDKNLASYSQGAKNSATGELFGPTDKVNALPLYQSKGVTADSVKNDLIKFRIAVYNPHDKSQNKTYIHFRAFLESFQDNFTSQWENFKYMGRSEDFYKYQGFDRNISLSWKLAAQSRQELIIMYKKLNYLQSVMTGDYSEMGYMEGNIVNLTVGGYFWEQPGIFTSLNVTFPQDSPFEIGIPDPLAGAERNSGQSIDTRKEVKEVPHYLDVNATFNPIHNFVPRKQQNKFTNGTLDSYGSERFINLSSEGGNSSYQTPNGSDKFDPNAGAGLSTTPETVAESTDSNQFGTPNNQTPTLGGLSLF